MDITRSFATVKNTKVELILKILQDFLRLKSGVTADINLSLVNDYERKCEVITKKHNYSEFTKDEIKKR